MVTIAIIDDGGLLELVTIKEVSTEAKANEVIAAARNAGHDAVVIS